MNAMQQGFVAVILHAHLPYVRHPEHESFLEERWLFEAISETYIPLLTVMEKLTEEGCDFRLTMSLTPPLLTMLSDKLLVSRYIKYLDGLISLTEKELGRTIDDPELNRLAGMYNEKYSNDLLVFRDRYDCDLIAAFARIMAQGKLEIIASAATHGFLPLLSLTPESLKAQIVIGVEAHERFFGSRPRGIWLPECGYTPAVERVLYENGIEYFIIEAHGLLYANPRPVFGTYSPIVTPQGLVVFGRDAESSKQVWSSREGYPGDSDYREFYRDIGYDLDLDYIRDYISPDGQRTSTGIKYYRVTGGNGDKLLYDPELASAKASMHAEDFMACREQQLLRLNAAMDRPPIVVCPYDAELFGHWWFEGPQWLYGLFSRIHKSQGTFRLTTPGEYMDNFPVMQMASPCPSTWGNRGYSEVWLNSSNDWIYRHLDKAAERMVELANEFPEAEGLTRAALNQAARELLLAQSSDWAFIMRTGTVVQYAVKRIRDHIGRFTRLYTDIKENSLDESWVREIEFCDSIFPDMDYRVYASGRLSSLPTADSRAASENYRPKGV